MGTPIGPSSPVVQRSRAERHRCTAGLALALAAAVVIALGAVGCSADSDRGDSAAPKASAKPKAGATEQPVLASQTADRDAHEIVRTASVVVRVSGLERATRRATDLVEAAGGFVSAQTADLEGDGDVDITFSIPPERFTAVLNRLGEVGRTLSRTIGTEDVTHDVVDLQGRLDGAKASAERLRDLLGGAASTSDLVAIEKELTTRESEIESMEGQLRALRDRVDLATIEARFTETAKIAVDHDLPGFLEGLRAGVVAVATGTLLVLSIAGFLLPFVPFAILAFVIVRRYRRRHPRPTAPIAPAFPPPPPGPSA